MEKEKEIKNVEEIAADEVSVKESTSEEISLEDITLEEVIEKDDSAEKEDSIGEIVLEEDTEPETMQEDLGELPETVQEDLEELPETVQEDSEEPTEIVQENVTEETSAEADAELTEEKAKTGKLKINKKTATVLGIISSILLIAYFSVAMYFTERFLPGTSINGEVCAGQKVEELEAKMQMMVEEYVLTLEERGNVSEQMKGTDFAIQYKNTGAIQKALENQNPYAWILSLFQKTDLTIKADYIYDEAKLNEQIAGLNCMQAENQEAPVSAVPVYKDGCFVIQEETYGTQIQTEEFTKAVIESINEMKRVMNLEEEECYVTPVYLKDSEEVVAANEALNKCLATNITYSLDSVVVKLDKSQIANWLSVDEEMNVILSESDVRAFAEMLGDKYNTPPRPQTITTPTGKVAQVSGATKGRVIGTAAECERLMTDIKEGTVVTREPVIAQHATPEGQYTWGTTYVEVDLSAQHMWYIQNGNVVFDSAVITGSPGRNTPAGVFEILTKKRNKTLVGNIVPETGEPEYRTPVSYWARVTWSGIGFHDATWQPAFGGQLYKQGYGSHGCINMPLGAVAQFYGMISVGDPVVIHY